MGAGLFGPITYGWAIGPKCSRQAAPSLFEQPGAKEWLSTRDPAAAARLSHPNIVLAYSVPRAGNLLVFAMEYVAGQWTWANLSNKGAALPVTNAAYYVHQVALGLQHAHEKEMVHRDIKLQQQPDPVGPGASDIW